MLYLNNELANKPFERRNVNDTQKKKNLILWYNRKENFINIYCDVFASSEMWCDDDKYYYCNRYLYEVDQKIIL